MTNIERQSAEYVRACIAYHLPRRVRWMLNDVPFDHDFSRAESVLKPLGATEGGGVAHSRWSDILVFGRQNYASGGGASPFVGVHCGSWEVLELDVESEVEVRRQG